MHKKKVSILITAITVGGAERVVLTLIQNLKQDVELNLVLLQNIIELKMPDGVKIHFLNSVNRSEMGIVKILKLPILAYRYSRLCRENKIDISISFLSRAHYVNCMSRLFGYNQKIIICERTYVSEYFKSMNIVTGGIQRIILKKLYPKANLIIPNSLLSEIDLKENFKIKTEFKVINNPIDLKTINQLASENVNNFLFDDFTFIHVAVMRAEKNYDLLIDAFYLIKDLKCKLLLLGKGEMETVIRKKIKQLDLEMRVSLLGRDTNPYKYLAKANCFVLSSNFEGFPNVILESLACKLPVISTDCKSGPREILAPGTNIRFTHKDNIELARYGVLVPVNNSKLMAKAMRLLYEDQEIRKEYKNRSLERAENYNLNDIVDQFRKVLQS